ncbi:MAG TPA: hypothetical protein VGR15_01060 [Bacteroidota bacterium]|jgi:hypothetical protein|nr:hypothetical protein [Bacteroidota bacterium]
MSKVKLIVAVLLICGSFLSGTPAKALCTTAGSAALKICYEECNQLSVSALRDACKVGCYIGCLSSGAA